MAGIVVAALPLRDLRVLFGNVVLLVVSKHRFVNVGTRTHDLVLSSLKTISVMVSFRVVRLFRGYLILLFLSVVGLCWLRSGWQWAKQQAVSLSLQMRIFGLRAVASSFTIA